MKIIAAAVLIFIIALSIIPSSHVFAGDYITDAVEALKTSNVYVAPDTPGTDYDTASKLKNFLTQTDNIVLVLLPADALAGTDIYTVAQKISAGLDNQKTIGLAVGKELLGYSLILPEGVANDKMNRASTVSGDSVTALTIFTQNIHTWQDYNPQPTPSPTLEPTPTPRPTMKPIELPKIDGSSPQSKVALGFIGLITIGFVIFLMLKALPPLLRKNKFQPARKSTAVMEELVSDIQDRDIRRELTKACNYAYGLLDILEASDKYVGKVEDLFPLLLNSNIVQINALVRHESGIQPLSPDKLAQITQNLLNSDDLFLKLQENDPNTVELLTSIFMSENAIVSHVGYFPTKKDN